MTIEPLTETKSSEPEDMIPLSSCDGMLRTGWGEVTPSDSLDELLRSGLGLRLISIRLAFPEILFALRPVLDAERSKKPKLKLPVCCTLRSLGGTVGGVLGGRVITTCLYL